MAAKKRLTQVAVFGERGTRGGRLSAGRGYRMVRIRDNKQWVASVLTTVKVGSDTIAIVKVSPGWKA